jgi:hypothetical protein
MGLIGGILPDRRLRLHHPMGHRRERARAEPLRPADRGGPLHDDLLLFAINMAMVMGLAPVVGVPLPLISFGGTSQMTIMICIGILMGIERSNRTRSRFG